MEGRSLRATIEQADDGEAYAFTSQFAEVAVNDDRYTLRRKLPRGRPSLHDRALDPDYRKDITSEQPEAADRLQAALQAWVASGGLKGPDAIARDAQKIESELRALGYIE